MIHAAAATVAGNLEQSHIADWLRPSSRGDSAQCLNPGPGLSFATWGQPRAAALNITHNAGASEEIQVLISELTSIHPPVLNFIKTGLCVPSCQGVGPRQPLKTHPNKCQLGLTISKSSIDRKNFFRERIADRSALARHAIYLHMDTMKPQNETIYLLDSKGQHTEGAYCHINLCYYPGQFAPRHDFR